MEIEKKDKNSVTIKFNSRELLILNNALNEICNGIEIPEFETRIGASLNDANRLLSDFNSILSDSEN
jgi:hypothetical protein